MSARWLFASATCAVLAGVAALAQGALRANPLPLDARLSVRQGSTLRANGELQPGTELPRARASENAAAQRVSGLLPKIPSQFAPTQLTLELDPTLAAGVPPLRFAECHTGSGSLLVGADAQRLPDGVWLHELGHVRLHGARPNALLARRVLEALEEGVADYYAAVVGGTPVLGTDEQRRDLRQPSPAGASEWASLAFPGFDPHHLGWALAATLYAAEPSPGELLREAVACLDGDSALRAAELPGPAIEALLAACPEPGKQRFSSLIQDWFPAEMFTESSPP